ncbi:MAG: hypothetical protein AB7N76_09645 [Planctomycetota bacterium]
MSADANDAALFELLDQALGRPFLDRRRALLVTELQTARPELYPGARPSLVAIAVEGTPPRATLIVNLPHGEARLLPCRGRYGRLVGSSCSTCRSAGRRESLAAAWDVVVGFLRSRGVEVER